MNLAIAQNWYQKKFICNWLKQDEFLNTEDNIPFKKPFFIKTNIFHPVKLKQDYINKIIQQNRCFNQNIFEDYDCSEYKYPNIVKQKLKKYYKFNALYNNIIIDKQEKSKLIQQLIPKYKKQLEQFEII